MTDHVIDAVDVISKMYGAANAKKKITRITVTEKSCNVEHAYDTEKVIVLIFFNKLVYNFTPNL